MEKLLEVHRTSTPGFPYCTKYATNGEWLDSIDVVPLFVEVRNRVKLLLESEESWCDKVTDDPFWAVEQGLCSPVKPFQKKEPHDSKKIKEGRFRIICGISLVDQVVERVFGSDWAYSVKASFPEAPATLGLGFDDDQIARLGNYISSKVDIGVHSSDISGFDSMQQRKMLQAENSIRVRNCINASRCQKWQKAINLLTCLKTACVYALPSGIVVCKFNNLRVLPSGSYDTSIKQSYSRAILAKLAGSVFCRAQGDDCLEVNEASSEELSCRYSDLGFPLKTVQFQSSHDFEFCSHRYICVDGAWKAPLVSWPKMIFRLLTLEEVELAQVSAVYSEMRHNDELKELRFQELFERLFDKALSARLPQTKLKQ